MRGEQHLAQTDAMHREADALGERAELEAACADLTFAQARLQAEATAREAAEIRCAATSRLLFAAGLG